MSEQAGQTPLTDVELSVLSALPIPFVIGRNDPELNVVFVNRCFSESYGYRLEDIPTVFAWAEQACPDIEYRQALFQRWDQSVRTAMEAGTDVEPMEAQIFTRSGEIRSVSIQATVIGEYTVTAFFDTTSIKQVEDKLETAKRSLQQVALDLTENIPVGTYTMIQPADGGMAYFDFMSPRFLELTGLEREAAEADPMQAFACVHPDDFDAWVVKNAEVFEKKVPFYGETRVVVDGEVRWITAESIPRPLSDGSTVWEGVLADITARKNAEAELREAVLRAERLEQAKGEFLANMSHEIRTPMNAVLGLAELLAAEPLTARQQELVSRLGNAGDLLLTIINDVLDLSKIEAGKLQIRKRNFSLQDLISKIINLYAPLAEDKGLELAVGQNNKSLPDGVFGDPQRIEQIIGNLLSNAIKFTANGQVRLIVELWPGDGAEMRIRFSVTDTGTGMNAEEQARLFQPFEQAQKDNDNPTTGTGLGLSISHRLVELMGGRMGVESRVGHGSTFWFEVPFRRADRATPQSSNQPSLAVEQSNKLAGLCILVVDDGELNRFLAREFIQDAGGRCVLMEHGRETLAWLKQNGAQFDAALIDIQMPDIDGLALAREIRQGLGITDKPLIAFTAGVMHEQRVKALAAGMNDVLLKPLDSSSLTACLVYWCGREPLAGSGRQLDLPPAPDDLPQVAGIDREHASGTTGGDAEHFAEVLTLFRREFIDAGQQFQAAIENADMATAARLVHSVRGAARQIGALGLARVAESLEKAIETDADLEDLMVSFEAHLQVIVSHGY